MLTVCMFLLSVCLKMLHKDVLKELVSVLRLFSFFFCYIFVEAITWASNANLSSFNMQILHLQILNPLVHSQTTPPWDSAPAS